MSKPTLILAFCLLLVFGFRRQGCQRGMGLGSRVADLMKERSAGERLGRSFNALVELDAKQISDAMDDVIRITECALSSVVPGFASDKDENKGN